MSVLGGLVLTLSGTVGFLAAFTALAARRIGRRHPPAGAFVAADATRLHVVHVPPGAAADLPPLVFVHGASGNLLDQWLPLAPRFAGRAEMLFFDRPGHGWSQRGPASNDTPFGQADTLAALMDACGIERAIVVGHSFGGSIAAAFALNHPGRTAGLVFLSSATHPWPGGKTSWYYALTVRPWLGRLFARTLALPAGLVRMRQAVACVFSPNAVPPGYADDTAIGLVLRPAAFRANAVDVENLHAHALVAAPRYRDIAAPTVVVTGDRDTVVYEEIHSVGLARDIAGAAFVQVRNLGHKPEWIAPELVVAAVEAVAGKGTDVQAAARTVEARIAGDTFGPLTRCPDLKAPDA